MRPFVESDIFIKVLAYLDHLKDFMEIFQDGAFPNLDYHFFSSDLVFFQHYLGKFTVTKETFWRNRHINLGLSIFGHILNDFLEIFQDGAFPNLEYHLFQLIRCFSALIR